MPRPRRCQRALGIYHVCSAAQAHGPLYETDEDVQRQWSALAWATREGWVKVLCGVHLNTHGHFVVQSLDGRLDRFMQRTQHAYSRHYNRTRARRGHVFKARYWSREIEDRIDLAVTVDYIDWNPVAAGMVESPSAYPHGTARYYCGDTGLPWLARDPLEEMACRLSDATTYRTEHYAALWKFAHRAGSRDLVARAMKRRGGQVAPLAILAQAGPEHVQAWLAERMLSEEGRTRPCLVVSGSELLRWMAASDVPPDREGQMLRTGLLNLVSGWTLQEIARHLTLSLSTAARLLASHRDRLAGDALYLEKAGSIVSGVTAALYGGLVTGVPLLAPRQERA